jgi:siroheme synthase
MEYLAAHGIPFEVVPGISAANGIAASACIPLTHREHAQRCVFVTGHLKDGSMDLEWRSLATPAQTLVVYMGLTALPVLCAELVRHGLPAATPAAIVQQGTLPGQRVVTATLATLASRAVAERLASPTLVIVGDVVRVRERVLAHAASAAARIPLPS